MMMMMLTQLLLTHVVTRKEQRDVVECAFQESRRLLHQAMVTITVRGSPGTYRQEWGLLDLHQNNQDEPRRRATTANSFLRRVINIKIVACT